MSMTKVDEITMLEKLRKNDTYFADCFSQDSIKQMQSNIKNDFPLNYNIDEFKEVEEGVIEERDKAQMKVEELQQVVEDQEKQKKNFKKRMVAKFYQFADDENLQEWIYRVVDIKDIIRVKTQYGINLNDTDRGWLTNNL